MNALPALRETHIAVHEIFDFEAGPFSQQRKLVQGQFAARDDPRDPALLQ